MFKNRLEELAAGDIHRVVAEQVQEGPEVEFKAALPAKDSRGDPWINGASHIGDRARNEIVEEVIAFANAHGGTLIVGIAESEGRPARAASVSPIPRCLELAERLKLQCRDCIEPQIPLLECAGVSLEDNGSGAVVIRVPASRMAPHRHTVTRECYIRRADRSEKMAMREIQDLTLNVERGLQRIENQLSARRAAFEDEFSCKVRSKALEREGFDKGFGVVFTMVPLVPLNAGRVHDNPDFMPPLQVLRARFENGVEVELHTSRHSSQWTPILRGSRCMSQTTRGLYRREVYADGLIEYAAIWNASESDFIVYPGWIMGLAGNALCAVEKFRRGAGSPEVEYALDATFFATHDDIAITSYSSRGPYESMGSMPQGRTEFPRYSVGGLDDLNNVLSAFETDFWNAIGRDWDGKLTIDFHDFF